MKIELHVVSTMQGSQGIQVQYNSGMVKLIHNMYFICVQSQKQITFKIQRSLGFDRQNIINDSFDFKLLYVCFLVTKLTEWINLKYELKFI